MKWLSRILTDEMSQLVLFDWRDKYFGYDCSELIAASTENIMDITDPMIVLCVKEFSIVSDFINYVVNSPISHIPVLHDCTHNYSPFEQVEPYKTIADKACQRAHSLNPLDIKGNIVEFGAFSGGSAAFIIETLKTLNIRKEVWLFDSYCGLPKADLGIDHR